MAPPCASPILKKTAPRIPKAPDGIPDGRGKSRNRRGKARSTNARRPPALDNPGPGRYLITQYNRTTNAPHKVAPTGSRTKVFSWKFLH